MTDVKMSNASRVRMAAFAMVLASAMSCSRDAPDIVVVEALPSPDGKWTATVFHETGGGAAGYVHENVVIHKAGTRFEPRERLLLDGAYLHVGARWLGNLRLEVDFRGSHGASTRRDSAMGVQVVYEVK